MGDRYSVNDAFLKIYNSLIEKKAIKSKGELARILGISPSTLSEIIAKRQGVTVEFIQKFCEAFPIVTPNDFFGVKSADDHAQSEKIISLQQQVLELQEKLIDAQKKML